MNENNANPQNQQPNGHQTTITLKWWHLVIAAIAVAAISITCTLAVTTLTQPTQQATTQDSSTPTIEDNTNTDTEEQEIPQSETSERGYLMKGIGDEAAILKTDGKTKVASWTLTGIETDITCTGEYAQPSENGHLVALDFDVQTYEDLIQVHGYPLTLTSGGLWQYYNTDGSLWNGTPISDAAYSCLTDTETLPNSIGASTKASGKIIFDLPSTDGILVFSDDGGTSGWEYHLKEHPSA